VRVRAPFHVAATYEQGWELFSFRAMVEWIGEVRWDYYFCQRLASQGQRLLLRMDFEKWLLRRKFVRRRESGAEKEK
jgi:hypothetical protein